MPLSETHEEIRRVARRFAEEVVRPQAEALDREEAFPGDIYRQMGELGLFGITTPAELGGAGLDVLAYALVMEELSRGYASVADQCGLYELIATLLSVHGTPAQQERWLPAIVSGEAIIAAAIDEGRKHAPEKTALKAEASGNGFRLSGAKTFVADGQVADAFLVAARTAGAPGDAQGISLFLVDAKAAGLSSEQVVTLDSRGAAHLTFDNVQVTGADVLGEVDDGHGLLEIVLGAGRAGLAAELSGNAQETFGRTVAYLKARKQFGRTIGAFQALQHRAAHLFAEVEIAKSAVMAALTALDADAAKASLQVSVAKSKAASVARLAAQEAIQMHGGIGMTDAIDIGLFAKRMQVASELYGDADFHADRVALARGF